MAKITTTTKPIKISQIKRDWYEIDVSDKILGRIATKISLILQGKNKSTFVPHLDCGDYVVVVNADEVKLTGKKPMEKIYTKYSGYPGGLKKIAFDRLIKKNAAVVIRHAVSGMLPKNKLRDKYLKRLFIFNDEIHPYKERIKNKL